MEGKVLDLGDAPYGQLDCPMDDFGLEGQGDGTYQCPYCRRRWGFVEVANLV